MTHLMIFPLAMKYLVVFMIALFQLSCASGQQEKTEESHESEMTSASQGIEYLTELEQAIVGEWTNVSMRVKVESFENSDTSFIVHITEENWDTKMNIRPIVTTIYADGTYTSEFRNSFDSLIYKPEGTWVIDGDSLFMTDHQDTYRYQIFVDGDVAEFNSIVDWDNDGKVDDEYFGVQHKN